MVSKCNLGPISREKALFVYHDHELGRKINHTGSERISTYVVHGIADLYA